VLDEELEELRELWNKNAQEAEEQMSKEVNVTLQELEGVPPEVLNLLVNASGDGNLKSISLASSYDVLVFSKNEDLIQKL
jgi:hypothetical protein